MTGRKYNLVQIIRDPRAQVYETFDLTQEGHYYIYRYDACEEVFTRATVPSGAADVQFLTLRETDCVPIGGWQVVDIRRRETPRRRLHVVGSGGEESDPCADIEPGDQIGRSNPGAS